MTLVTKERYGDGICLGAGDDCEAEHHCRGIKVLRRRQLWAAVRSASCDTVVGGPNQQFGFLCGCPAIRINEPCVV